MARRRSAPAAGFPDRGSGGFSVNNVLYGRAVGLDGDVAVVGAPIFASGREAEPARAFVYERRGGAWAEAAELRPPTPTPGAQLGFFGLPVDVSAGRVAVRASSASSASAEGVADPGVVFLYERSGSGWVEVARVVETELEPANGLGLGSGFGSGMALDGDRLAVGSGGQNVGGIRDAGLVRVYHRSGTSWPLVATLGAPSPRRNDQLGAVVALDGSVLAASAIAREVEGEVGAGSVLVFREAGGAWAFEAELRPPGLGFLDSYGFAVAASSGPAGDRVAVSAAGRAQTRGSVFVWVRRPSGAWALEAEVWPEGRGPGTSFGEGLALDGDRLLAGAIAVDGERGAVYEFRRGPGGWAQVK